MIDKEQFVRLEACILQWREVAAIFANEDDTTRATIILRSGKAIHLKGFEAAEAWKLFDPDRDWSENS